MNKLTLEAYKELSHMHTYQYYDAPVMWISRDKDKDWWLICLIDALSNEAEALFQIVPANIYLVVRYKDVVEVNTLENGEMDLRTFYMTREKYYVISNGTDGEHESCDQIFLEALFDILPKEGDLI